jgi:pimeloyl-ACP methyl ester carboxylesterase
MTEGSLDHEPHRITSFDGTEIAARRIGTADGIPLLVVTSIGTGLSPWRKTLRRVVVDRPIVTWDLRGQFESAVPETSRFDASSHAEDALAVLGDQGIEEFSVAAWSTGAPIAIELAAREPERVRNLVLVSGGFGHTLTRLFRYFELTSAFPVIAGVAKHFSGPLQGVMQRFAARPELPGLARQSGFMAPTVDLPAFVEMLRGMADNDLKILLRTYEQVVGDSVFNSAVAVQAPTLLIVGDHDQFVPLRMIERMQRAMTDARLEIYERATHFLPFEQPDRLAEDLQSFLR